MLIGGPPTRKRWLLILGAEAVEGGGRGSSSEAKGRETDGGGYAASDSVDGVEEPGLRIRKEWPKALCDDNLLHICVRGRSSNLTKEKRRDNERL